MKDRSMKYALLLGAIAATPFAFVAPAIAQEAPAVEEDSTEIVVTARRRAESLQDVPLAVTAITGEQLEATGAADITILTRTTPNVTFETSRGTNSTLTAFIRGVGQQDPVWGFEPGVGLYVDDVYISRPQGALLDVYDVERLEVLRGPQGTLYGRNTIGGAIKYVTARLADDPSLSAKVNVGSYNQLDGIASGSIRLSDQFAVGGAFAALTRDGFGRNVNTGAEHYNKDVQSGRVSLEFTPSDNFFLRLAADRTEDNSNAKHGHRELASRNGLLPVLPDVYDTRAGAGDINYVLTQGMSAQAEWTVNDSLTLKSITAYREGESTTAIDFDGLPQRDLDVPAFYADEQVSQEFQALIDVGNLSGVAGVYYLNGIADGAFDTVLSSLGVTVNVYGKMKTISTSVFADLTYDFTDQWSVSLGGRYTEDQKTGTVVRANYLGLGSPLVSGTTNPRLGGFATNFTRERTDEKFSPRVSVNFEPNDNLSLYASYSQGFKSGGFDPRANFSATNVALQPTVLSGFAPETVDSFELGLKGTFFDRLTLRTAYFFSKYEDQQVTVQQGADTNSDGINDTFVSTVLNAASAEYQGVEIEGSLDIVDNLRANFSLGWIDASIDEVISAGVNVQTDANPLNNFVAQNTPEWTGSLGLSYNASLGDLGNILFTGSGSYRSEYYIFSGLFNQGFAAGASPQYPAGGPKLDADSVTLLDLSAVWTSSNGHLTVGLHGKNLSDERYRTALYNFAYPPAGFLGFDSSYTAFYGPPRTVTATIGVKF
ncbi:MAG: TonB-dependent receptor [Alphaproteobacteria bacterium]|nr:TonB-dependent receptor [Alphaproteobacteria bacterium]